MALDMHRGKLQSLYQYMPEQTYNWERGRGSFKGTSDVDASPLDIPEGWLRRPLLRLLSGFGERDEDGRVATRWSGREIVSRGEFEVLEPRTLRGEFYPRVFFCTECGKVLSGLADAPDRVECHDCRRRMRQLPFVEYHRCGHLSGLVPPRCRHGCGSPMLLVGADGTPRSTDDRRFRNWGWRCSRCRVAADRGVYRGCPACRRGQVRVAAADAGPVYYAQDITVINPPREQDWGILQASNIYRAAVAQALGLLPTGLEGLRQAVNDAGSPSSIEEIRANAIRDYGLDPSDPDDAELLETLVARGSRSTESTAEPHWEERVDALGLEEEDLEEVGSECIDLALTLDPGDQRQASRILTISDMIDENPTSPMVGTYTTRYREALDRYGIVDITLIKEFPIARVVAGFTREEKNPRAVGGDLRFHFFEGEHGRKAMYGHRTVTEALLVQVDPDRIVTWLNSCTSTASASGEGLGEPLEGDAKSWLFRNLRPVTSIFDDPQDLLTAGVLGLLHSMSHRFIAALTERSGLKADSITERILPYNGAFLVYPGGRSDFILGGLEHVFRNHLHEALTSAAEDDTRCVFDPPCDARGGACAVCMYLSEVSCERFNTALSRHFLFGGTSRNVRWQGFWDA